jgi:hypothetical protein
MAQTETPNSNRKRIRLADVFREPDEIELPSGLVAPIKPFDAIAYELYQEFAADRGANVQLAWTIAARCLPTVPVEEIRELSAPFALAVVMAGAGELDLVQAMAEELAGKTTAPTVAAPNPERPTSSTPSDLSAAQ